MLTGLCKGTHGQVRLELVHGGLEGGIRLERQSCRLQAKRQSADRTEPLLLEKRRT